MTKEEQKLFTLERMKVDFATLKSSSKLFKEGFTIYDYYDLKRVIAILEQTGCTDSALGNVIEWCKERGAHISNAGYYHVITL